jgi:ssDNA-binding Zn-finger/Zn-ribbon topoisomerase 1
VVISFLCPHCRQQLEFDDLGHDAAPCPACGQPIQLRITERMRRENIVDQCAVCECHKVYVQKDFNRTLGLSIFITGAVISLVLFGFNWVWSAFGVLLLCAAADGILYKVLPEVTICYKCHSQYRRFTPCATNREFELGLAEKYDPLDKQAGAENPAVDWKGR